MPCLQEPAHPVWLFNEPSDTGHEIPVIANAELTIEVIKPLHIREFVHTYYGYKYDRVGYVVNHVGIREFMESKNYVLNKEIENGMPEEIISNAKKFEIGKK